MLTQLQTTKSLQDLSAKLDPTMFVVALLVSLASSLVASWMYTHFCERKGTGTQINRAFPLLGISVTTLFICVQISLPLSLGLLGALSIIRFRTPVKEPEETGFILLVIAAAITCSTFNFQFLGILFVVALLALYIQNRRQAGRRAADGILVVTLSDADAVKHQGGLSDCLSRNARSAALESSTSRDGVTSLHFSFCGLRLRAAEASSLLRQQADLSSVNIFFNRPG